MLETSEILRACAKVEMTGESLRALMVSFGWNDLSVSSGD